MFIYNSRIIDVKIDSDCIRFSLDSGCEIGAPISWYPKLERASLRELKVFRLTECGTGIFWDNLDEMIKLKDIIFGKNNTGIEGYRPLDL